MKMTKLAKTFTSACILRVEVESTGKCGGDSGHGARAIVRLIDDGGADIKAKYVESSNAIGSRLVEIEVGGDCELDVLARALIWAGSNLLEINDYPPEDAE